jgi:hypothetical protein
VVEATKNGQIEYWAVATHRDDALAVVRGQTSSDWNLILTERRLTHEQAVELKMMHNTVLKLEAASEIECPAPFWISMALLQMALYPRGATGATETRARLRHPVAPGRVSLWIDDFRRLPITKPHVPLKDLATGVMMGVRDEDTVSSLAGRLARLDKQLDDQEQARRCRREVGRNWVWRSLRGVYPRIIRR